MSFSAPPVPLTASFNDVHDLGLGVDTVGGKALHLSALSQTCPDFASVPSGIVVTAAAFSTHLAKLRVDLSSLAAVAAQAPTPSHLADLRRRVCLQPLSRDVLDAVVAAVDADGIYAVRSSGTMEDMGAASFAGQYDTVLGVPGTRAALEAAIKQCFASQFNDHVASYLKRAMKGKSGSGGGGSGTDAAFPRMAVVVQQQVQALAAGVLFSVNPSNVAVPEVVMEAVWGLGEGLVSGDLSPHTLVVEWDGVRGATRTVSSDSSPQSEKYVCALGGRSGAVKVPCTPAEHASSVFQDLPELSDDLVRLGIAVSGTCGVPQDIEWVVTSAPASPKGYDLYVVQSRPITSFSLPRHQQDHHMLLAGASCVFDESLCANGFNQLVMAFPGSWDCDIGLQVVFGRAYVDYRAFCAVWATYPEYFAPEFWDGAYLGAQALYHEFYGGSGAQGGWSG